MSAARTVSSAERRARLALRHGLVDGARATDVVDAARRVAGLHATDPSTIALSAWARVPGFVPADLERALHDERALVKHLAMRRTLWVVPREDLPAVQAAASDRVALAERRRLVKDVEAADLHPDGEAWIAAATHEVLAALADGREASSTTLRDELPTLRGGTMQGVGKPWGGEVPVGPRLLNVLHAEGVLTRGTNDGRWTASRPLWAAMDDWLGAPFARLDAAEGTRVLVAAWLRAYGPGTVEDVKWWLGGTLGAVRAAVADLEAVEVAVEGDDTPAYVLPDDVDPVDPREVGPWAALLPSLDPATMGWYGRDWYLAPHRPELFDYAGNAGPTAWWDGRAVGTWAQDAGGRVVVALLEDVPRPARRALDAEAARLTEWLGDVRILPRFPSPASKRLAAGA